MDFPTAANSIEVQGLAVFTSCWAVLIGAAGAIFIGTRKKSPRLMRAAIGLAAVVGIAAGIWAASAAPALAQRPEDTRSEVLLGLLLWGTIYPWIFLLGWGTARLNRLVHPPEQRYGPWLPRYDRSWLLSLLQRAKAADRERVATSTTPPSGPGSSSFDRPNA